MTREEHRRFLEGIPTPPEPPRVRAKPEAKPTPALNVVDGVHPSSDALRRTVDRSTERLFHEDRVDTHRWRKNKARYGSTMPPSKAAERALHLQLNLDSAMHRIRYNQMMERYYRKQLDPFHLGLYGPNED